MTGKGEFPVNCPYCGKEMLPGTIHDGTSPVQWIPEGGKGPFWKGTLGKGAVPLGGGDFWTGYSAAAWRCPDCSVVVIPKST